MSTGQAEDWDYLLQLNPQECAVLFHLCHNASNEKIAEDLAISPSQFYKVYDSICDKLGVHDLSRSQRRMVIGRDYCPAFLEKAESAQTAWHDIRRDRAQSRSGGAVGGETRKEAGGQAHADSSAQSAPGQKDSGSTEQNGQSGGWPGDSNPAGQRAQEPAGQPGTSDTSPDLSALPRNGLPGWLLPVVLLVTVVLVGVGVTIGMLLGRGPSTVPPLAPTSAPGTSAYTPSPTPAPVYASPRTSTPISVAPTASDTQNPAPGTIIPAGQAFARAGVTVVASRDLNILWGQAGPRVKIYNGSGGPIVVRWQPSALHLVDDTSTEYHQLYEDTAGYHQVFQFSMPAGATQMLTASGTGFFDNAYAYFKGPIAMKAKYVILRIDQIAGLSDLRWRYDLP